MERELAATRSATSISLALVMWLIRLALWPFYFFDAIFQHDSSGVAFWVMLLITTLFWGFFIELFLVAKSRLRLTPRSRQQS